MTDRLVLLRAALPACLLDALPQNCAADADGLIHADVTIEDGRIVAIDKAAGDAGAVNPEADTRRRDCAGGMVFPGFVDMHTHLDKGHIWPRRRNPDGSFPGALAATRADREAFWSEEDVEARMEFSLRTAFAHGTVAIRTHLDSGGARGLSGWPVYRAVAARWRGRIALQAVSLATLDAYAGAAGEAIADRVASACERPNDASLGAVVMGAVRPEALARLFALAADRELDLDLHVDETGDPGPTALEAIAEAVPATPGFRGQVTCGHCCSLSVQSPEEAARIIGRARAAGLHVVSLPMCNLYLQDRAGGRTPRWRGMAPVQELAAAGVKVALASDNTRDPFFAYGDLDMLEVLRQSVRIGHLDHDGDGSMLGDWPRAVTATPAALMGLSDQGRIGVGRAADLVLFTARDWTELFARPQADRAVLRAGVAIDTSPPPYALLDRLRGMPARV